MGVFKEHARAFEAVAKLQNRIWDDACDYGFAYDTARPPQIVEDLLHYVRDLKGTSLQRNRVANPLTGRVEITFRIGWEIDEGMECGTQYTITSQSINRPKEPSLIKKGCNSFITVEIENYREPYKNR